nr:hypothetical protein CFP56_58816 [Quercus suber]
MKTGCIGKPRLEQHDWDFDCGPVSLWKITTQKGISRRSTGLQAVGSFHLRSTSTQIEVLSSTAASTHALTLLLLSCSSPFLASTQQSKSHRASSTVRSMTINVKSPGLRSMLLTCQTRGFMESVTVPIRDSCSRMPEHTVLVSLRLMLLSRSHDDGACPVLDRMWLPGLGISPGTKKSSREPAHVHASEAFCQHCQLLQLFLVLSFLYTSIPGAGLVGTTI